jgi:hypothetical protein
MGAGDPAAHTYTVVLRCPSSARFLPEGGHHVVLPPLPGTVGNVIARLRTRWLDEGNEAPTPRELWVEVVVTTDSLDQATSIATRAARFLAAALAFTANVQTGTPEVHIAFDSSPGETRREFLEVFLPDEVRRDRDGRRNVTGQWEQSSWVQLVQTDEPRPDIPPREGNARGA